MNIKIAKDDNLPQQICINCINELKNIHLFRDKCKLAQNVLREYFIQSVIKSEINIDDTISEELQIIPEDLIREEKPLDDVLNENGIITAALKSNEEINPNEESKPAENSESRKDLEFTDNSRFGEESNLVGKENSKVIIDVFEIDEDLKEFVGAPYVEEEEEYKIFNADEKPKIAKCENCLYFAYKRQELYHRSSCTAMQDIFSCFYCSKSYKEEKEVVNHIIETHPKGRPYLCPICNEPFDIYQNCIKHVMEKHNHIKLPFTCDICLGSFKHLRMLRHHKRMAHDTGNYECCICNKKFKNIHRFEYHIKSHNKEKPFKCKYCPKSFMQTHHLKDHETVNHNGGKARRFRRKLYCCDICGKVFTKAALKKHIERHRNTPAEENMSKLKKKVNGNASNKANNYDCPSCSEQFASFLGLEKHLKMHDENRKYKCEFCGVGYKRKEHLTQHINSKHTKTKKYYCSFCNYVFFSCNTRNSHQKSHRPDGFQCSYCNKTFRYSSEARSHERSQHTKEKRHICWICNIGFDSYAKYTSHYTKMHSKEELMIMKEKLTENLKNNNGFDEIINKM